MIYLFNQSINSTIPTTSNMQVMHTNINLIVIFIFRVSGVNL